MDNLKQQISNVLMELRAASINIEDDPRKTMHKYDMLFFRRKV